MDEEGRPMKSVYGTYIFLAGLAFVLSATAQGQDGEQKIADLGRCTLESGQVIENCKVGYRTYGKLNAEGINAVLMATYLYGRSGELSSLFGDKPKPMLLVDTNRFFGVALDALGNGISSSPSNSESQHGIAFPAFTTRDMVETQYRVVTEVLHLKHAHAVIGLSMGGEQTFVWAVLHPTFFDLAVPIIATPRLTPFDLQTKEIMLEAINNDPDYHGGKYTEQPGLKVANLYNVQVVTTPEFRNAHTSRSGFAHFVEVSEAPVKMDANDRVWQLKAVMSQDVVKDKTISEVAQATPVRFLIIVNANDRMVNPQPALEWAAASNAPSYISQKPCGHLIMTCDAETISPMVQKFLAGESLH
jgi:homoserine O-acetyltransferase/O-succinyltransferase